MKNEGGKSTTAKSPKKSAKPRTSAEMSPVLSTSFFVDELKDILLGRKHLTKAIPKMQKPQAHQSCRLFADHYPPRSMSEVGTGFEMLKEKQWQRNDANGRYC